jgi:hypothetical protein
MSYDPGASIGIFVLIYGVLFGLFLIALLINYVLYAIALSMFFRKVGVESWIAWVPYYRY